MRTFASFRLGKENRFVCAVALDVAQCPGYCHNPVVFVGPSGRGKTHLLEAIASYVMDEGSVPACRPIPAGELVFPRAVLREDLALIDDFDELGFRNQERLLVVLRQVAENWRQVVVTSHQLDSRLSELAHFRGYGMLNLIDRLRQPYRWP